MTNDSSSFQSLGNGAYRVSGARVSPTTGKYVTRSSASTQKSKSATSGVDKAPSGKR
ncbi:hypothetical protein ABMA10_21860 [Plantibacter sp. RU18]